MNSPKRIVYLTGTRADFGLMERVLKEIDRSPALDLKLLVTGMHLSDHFGRTIREVEASGLQIADQIDVPIDDDSGRGMGVAAGQVTCGVAEYLGQNQTDAILLLGDRGEMLGAATAAMFAGVPIFHIAGGERSGSVDDSIRHAISKLSNVHFVACEDGAQRLLRMGECSDRIHQVGTPGLVGLSKEANVPLADIAKRYGFDPSLPYVLLLFHPVVQDASLAGKQWTEIFSTLALTDLQIVALMPNADHGTSSIGAAISAMAKEHRLILVEHMARKDYLSALKNAEFLIGNSSSGIIEAATLRSAVVDVGDRQVGRLRSENVFHTAICRDSISIAIKQAQEFDATGLVNIYGDEHADVRIREILEHTDLTDPSLRKKYMPY